MKAGVRRSMVIGAVAAVHVALVVSLEMGSTRAGSTIVPAAIIVREIPQPTASAPAIAPLPPIAVDLAIPVVEVAGDIGTTDDCPLIKSIAAALAHDRDVGAALAVQPANPTALMVWDGAWASDTSPAVAVIRRVVTENIRLASPACRNAAITGPRLFVVPNGTANIAIAIGSGTWQWVALLS